MKHLLSTFGVVPAALVLSTTRHPGETRTLYRDHPKIVADLTKLFEQLRDAGRSCED